MKRTTFADVLDAAGSLPIDQQEELVDLLHKRTIEERRNALAKEIKSARYEYKNNKCSAASSGEIMKAIL